MHVRLVGVRAENLRGYTNTYLPLDRPRTVIVGRNNSGKTSVLRLLDWLLNRAPTAAFSPSWILPPESEEFLLPARETKHKARRLTLYIRVSDGRSHEKFRCTKGIAELRLNVRLTPTPVAYLALGPATRSESSSTQAVATELLDRLRRDFRLLYVPSFRDAASDRFRKTLGRSLATRVENRALHQSQGGAPAEYRRVKTALSSVRTVLEKLGSSLWPTMQAHLPPGIADKGRISLDCDVHDLVQWLTGRMELRLSTGEHDSGTVALTELGSGLQSLLDLAVQQSDVVDGARTLLVIEEPESFLHPSAQRVVTRSLLGADESKTLIVTTHSSVVVDEARYGDVVICRNQRFYYPKARATPEREEINSALLSSQGAEMLFARSVLLVEGESDRLFFEKLRRRLAEVDATGSTDELFVVAVGGKQSFGPWLKLLESYRGPSDRPINWMVVGDGDAGADIARAFADAQISIPQQLTEKVAEVGSHQASPAQWATSIRELNKLTLAAQLRFALLPVDLESASLMSLSPAARIAIASKLNISISTTDELLQTLGSKAVARVGTAVKAPWMRGYIGAHLPWADMSSDILGILERWLAPVLSSTRVRQLIADTRL